MDLAAEREIGLAEAVFDNVAEWPDELAFRRGDLLRVLDERPGDGVADGWWLCADQRGRRGIAPANRLRMMHRFGLHENRMDDEPHPFQVITPQRFGDVFLYNNGRFPPFDDHLAPSRSVGGSSPFGLGDAFSSLSLIHGPERAFPLSPAERFSSLRRPADQPPTIRDIPIRIESTADANRMSLHRGSPPPPPQRKYFHLMTPPTTTSSSSDDERHRIGGGTLTRSPLSANKGDNLASKSTGGVEDVSWRRTQQGTTAAPDDTTDSGVHLLRASGTSQDEQRASAASSVSLSASERSSLSDPPDALSSAHGQTPVASSVLSSAYDVPSRLLHRPGTAQLSSSSKPPLAPKPVDAKKTETNGNTSVLLNVFEGLYDTPNRARTSASPVRSPAAPTGQRPWTFLRNPPANNGPNKTADDGVAHSIYDVPKTAMLDSNAPTANGNGSNSTTGLASTASASATTPTATMTATKPLPTSNPVIDRLIGNQRKLETCAQRMQTYTAPKFWRQPHVLQQNLMEIRESVTDVAVAIDDFVDTTARISVDRNEDQSNRLAQLLSPLRDTKALIARLKRTLDSTGWTLAALSRPRGADNGNDALDQFVAVVKQIPNDCRQMVQWAQTNPAIVFIRSDSADAGATSERRSLKTLSVDSGSIAGASSELASAAAAPPLSAVISAAPSNVTPSVNQHKGETRVIEEDDLHSIASDHESLFDDYDFVDGHGHVAPPATTNGNHQAKSNGNAEKTVAAVQQNGTTDKRHSILLTEEDRQILTFYSPQIDDHTDCLSSAIEEFLTSVEEQQPPKEFVQRSKLVILAAHKLVYIGDNVAQCVHAAQLSSDVRRAADRLCAVLKDCVAATKTAAEKYPAVTAVQTMVDGIVGVSHAAHDLKLLVRQSIR